MHKVLILKNEDGFAGRMGANRVEVFYGASSADLTRRFGVVPQATQTILNLKDGQGATVDTRYDARRIQEESIRMS